jgi:hypothetical protein
MSKDDATEQPEGVGWHVGGLLFFGGLSIFLNVWHATHASEATTAAGKAAQGSLLLGLIVGVVPPAIAGYMSHDVAKGRDIGKWALAVWITCALGMALSINAQAQVVRPYAGGGPVCWAFPVMIDLATFYSLSRLVASARTKAERAARTAAERAQARAQEAADRRARVEAERAQAQARADEARAQADEAQRAQAEAEARAQVQRERAQAREARRAQAEAERAQGGPEDDAKAGPSAGPGISQAEWQARIWTAIATDPGLVLSPSSVGVALEVDRQVRASGVFKRAVAAVRGEREAPPVGLRVVAAGE